MLVEPVRYARTTTSTLKGSQAFITLTLGCGTLSSALGHSAAVCCIHHAEVRFSTAPLCGTLHRLRSKADSRSVVTRISSLPTRYVSRTLPVYFTPTCSALPVQHGASSAGSAGAEAAAGAGVDILSARLG